MVMGKDHCSGQNLWILKPTNLNRGVGIHLFNDLNDLEKLLEDYNNGIEYKI